LRLSIAGPSGTGLAQRPGVRLAILQRTNVAAARSIFRAAPPARRRGRVTRGAPYLAQLAKTLEPC